MWPAGHQEAHNSSPINPSSPPAYTMQKMQSKGLLHAVCSSYRIDVSPAGHELSRHTPKVHPRPSWNTVGPSLLRPPLGPGGNEEDCNEASLWATCTGLCRCLGSLGRGSSYFVCCCALHCAMLAHPCLAPAIRSLNVRV